MKYSTILDTIGNTPVIELKRYSHNPHVKILAKLEGVNPGGSIKDRIALFMILDAQRKGLLNKSKTIIEPTSGNTGIGLAMISALFGYKFIAILSTSASRERRKLLTNYGADLILVDSVQGPNSTIETAHKLLDKNRNKYIMLDQYNNKMNPFAHYQTTGVEIIRQVPNITHFVAGMGTGGTIMGVTKRLKKYNSKIFVTGIEPNPVNTIQGLRNMSIYTPSIYSEQRMDKKLSITHDEAAFEFARDLSNNLGVSVGISSGAALWGTIEISKKIKKGIIVTIFPDRSDRYISTKLFP
jgi:cysteine synthase